MNLKLRSDFSDFYDHHFDRDGTPFRRFTTDGPDRPKMLATLRDRFGLKVPDHGIACRTISPSDNDGWVVHLDPTAHCGEGKIVVSARTAREKYPNDFVVRHIITAWDSSSIRHLQFGPRAYTLIYRSDDAWRSNCGEVEITIGRAAHPMDTAEVPLFAIDSVMDFNGTLWAIDYNVAPGMRGTGLEKLLSPAEVVAAIKSSPLLREAVPA